MDISGKFGRQKLDGKFYTVINGAPENEPEPNNAMEPIPVNVTVPADAGTVPFTSMAHL
jgi:hypothetical protein